MANQRVFDEVSGLVVNAENVGGVTQVTTEQSYLTNVQSEQDGLHGPAHADQGGQQVKVTIATTDVLQGIPVLTSTPGTMVFYGRQSGTSDYGKGTLQLPIFGSLAFNASKTGYANVSLNGQCRFLDGDKEFDYVEAWIVGEGAPTVLYPKRLLRPTTCVLDTLTALHVESLSFNVPGRILADYGDTDKGTTAVDKGGYGIPTVNLTIRDSTKQAGLDNWDIATALIKSAIKDLVVTFEGVADQVNQVLTLRNCKFTSKRKTGGHNWTGHTLSGVLQWQDPDGETNRTLDDATPADRLINFADVV